METNNLKIAIVEDHNGKESIDIRTSLGITPERQKFLHERMTALAPKHCKSPCNGSCALFAIQEMAPELQHVNELFYLAFVDGYKTAEHYGGGRPTVSITSINLGGKGE